MLKTEPQSKRQNKLQALYLTVTKQAQSRGKVAAMLGKNHNTISNWFIFYEAGGLAKLLEIYQPSGAKTKISEAALEEIKAILGSEKGSRTYQTSKFTKWWSRNIKLIFIIQMCLIW